MTHTQTKNISLINLRTIHRKYENKKVRKLRQMNSKFDIILNKAFGNEEGVSFRWLGSKFL
jgi:hypothetical protein